MAHLNIGGVPFFTLGAEGSHVLVQPRQLNMLASREAPVGRSLRLRQADGHEKVTVMPSMISNAGNGLFAYRTIETGERICGYAGTRSLSSSPHASGLAMELPGSLGVLIGDPASSFGPHANDPRDDLLVNAKLQYKNGEASLTAAQRIRPGEEIFLDYGLTFWQDRLHLLAPDAAEDTRTRLAASSRRSQPLADSDSDAASIPASIPSSDIASIHSLEWGDDSIHPRTARASPPTSEAESLTWFSEHGIKDLLRWTTEFFPELTADEATVQDVLVRAFKLGSSVFGTASANEWAGGFAIPPEALAEDDAKWVACRGNFRDLVREKRRAVDANRISAERAGKHLSDDNPFKVATIDLAVNGISLCTPSEYTGCGWEHKPATGKIFHETAPAVERMMFESYWQQGLSIILTEERVRTMETLGLCLASWAKKLGKQCGRPITNGSGKRGMPSTRIINGGKTKEIAKEKYGPIVHPVIGDVARLITTFEKDRGLERSDIRIWKFDLAAAYTKLSYEIDAVEHIGVELRGGRFMFFLGGVFGLTSMPFAFNVITSAIVWELNNKLLKGRMLQYVDDGFVVSKASEEEEDVRITLNFVRGLLGPDAVAIEKLERAASFDFLGWNTDLQSGLITIAERNILKAIYAYGVVDLSPGVKLPISTMQRLASLATRYSFVCHLLRPYVRVLYSSYRGKAHYGHVILSAGERCVVRTFKHLFVLLGLGGTTFARSFESFTPLPPAWVCEFDASLSGIGIIWFKINNESQEQDVAYAKVDITSLNFGEDASFQNTAEYTASLLCARGLTLLGAQGQPVLLRGDSVSALTWATKGTVRSDRALRAAAMWAQYVVMKGINVVGTHHLSHEINTRTDILSRQGSWHDVLAEDVQHYGGRLHPCTPELDLHCQNLLHLVDPQRPLDSDAEFGEFFNLTLKFFESEI